MKEKDKIFINNVAKANSHLESCLNSKDFIDPTDINGLIEEYKNLRNNAKSRSHNLRYIIGLVNQDLKNSIQTFSQIYDSFREKAKQHNHNLIPIKAKEVGLRINPVEGRDLDSQQLSTIAFDIKTRLIIAGAGTGKTTTIIGLVKEILNSKLANPEEILLLSFTNPSVNELRHRIADETGTEIETTTFHRLAMKIIRTADGKAPGVSNIDLERFLSEEMDRKIKDKGYVKALNRYLAYDYDSQKMESDFTNRTEYQLYLEENPLITINGEKVKSYGEADIANFLAINGVPYQYEESYPVNTITEKYGQYHPDFHLTGTNIYIEYFGTNRNGEVAKFMIDNNPNASIDYQKGIEWKREIHKENNTVLLELYAYNREEHELQSVLESKLKKLNIKLDPDSQSEEVNKALTKDERKKSAMIAMFKTLILLIKGRGGNWEDTFPKGSTLGEKKQFERLERVVKPLFDAYQKELRDKEEIDFEDMLNLAKYCVDEKGYEHHYKYVIVDEYQDLSFSRYSLLKSLRDSKDYKLFCVGDDWQSIYRFNGSDVSYILDFRKYWGPSGICKIETTYRFTGDLLRLSTEFVCRNERQYKKDLIGAGSENCSVNPVVAESPVDARKKLAHILSTIPQNSSVLFLGRYNLDVRLLKGDGFNWKPIVGEPNAMDISYFGRSDLKMKFRTVHSSKGLQANYVISLNNKTGSYGFPSMRNESPVISSLFGKNNTQMDEERRLFYVSMTRANKAFYLLAFKGEESTFFRELFGSSNGRKIAGCCPICGGIMILKNGRYGQFYGCSNYHSKGCKYTRPIE